MGIDNDSVRNALDLRGQDVPMKHARTIIETSDEPYITDKEYDQVAIGQKHVRKEDNPKRKGGPRKLGIVVTLFFLCAKIAHRT